ncbi:hypothetical protein [Phytohabitans suffuscus]|uniref:PknH-like extracellular domain-containing protein n=1 Tax=Phytohabitans suffuscus TaxID=624315 RepID=A0A6F8YKV5_9ACTN|nr:hypothetical protein [Phytohabitans suffuscus]BCB86754.1 hypothetical protein Psuf_040670 [Phytohabitans suffuscus]
MVLRRWFGFEGRHAHTGPRHARPNGISELLARPQKRTWQAFTTGLGIFTMLAVCGLSSFFIVADERQGRDAQASGAAPPVAVPRDISSREADPAPLTPAEVFPGPEVVVDPARPAYRVLKTQADRRCAAAASGEIGTLLTDLGCHQVVRGTLRAPSGGFLVTAGIFNLDDAEGANWAHEKIKSMVDGERGRFQGMRAGKGTEAIALSSARVGWHVRGHYLVYCVTARADGRPIPEGDAEAGQILTDLIERYLHGTVLEKRAVRSAP